MGRRIRINVVPFIVIALFILSAHVCTGADLFLKDRNEANDDARLRCAYCARALILCIKRERERERERERGNRELGFYEIARWSEAFLPLLWRY